MDLTPDFKGCHIPDEARRQPEAVIEDGKTSLVFTGALLPIVVVKKSESFRVVGSDGYIDYQYGSSAQSLVSLLTDFERNARRDQPSNCRILNRWLGGFEAIDSRVTSRLVWLLISVD